MNFWDNEAYKIAKRITNDRDIHRDLVAFIYILLHDRQINAISLPATFARYAYQQYNWRNSQFNKLYLSYSVDISSIDVQAVVTEYEESHYGNLLDEYFEQKSATDEEFFCKEIAKLVFQSMSYREIEALTGIRIKDIFNAIKQFKHDFKHYCQHRDSEVFNDLTTPGHEAV